MPQTYTFASWNVNGLRAVLKKDPSFIQIAQELDVDILALQETKLQEGQVDIDLPGYHQTWSYAERKGYSGTAVFSRQEPLRVLRADALLPYAGEGVYSWWSYRFNARKNNAGWRIDYFLVSDSIAANVRDTGIRGDIFGSDHCPVTLTLEL